jgi:carbonic anhydrase
MSCSNATAPVNISNNTTTTCDLKCDFSFKYPISNLQVTNRGDYISLRTDPTTVPPVTYNAQQYNVGEVRIYRPSLHTYGGKKADAEMVIIHNSSSGSGKLLVCVPFIKGVTLNQASTMFDSIISQVSKTAPSINKKTVINLPTFSLDSFVPMKPFYSYNGTLPYSPCNGKYDYVVFSKNNGGAISMSTSAYLLLSKIITANQYSVKSGSGGIFYNKNGPSQSTVGGDIYIECSPTGSDGETLVQTTSSGSMGSINRDTITNILNSSAFQVIVGILVLLGVMKLGKVIINKLTTVKKGTRSGGSGSSGRGGFKK